MLTGADSIDDLDVVRHGGMGELFGGVYAPSTLGSFLRAFSHGPAPETPSGAEHSDANATHGILAGHWHGDAAKTISSGNLLIREVPEGGK